MSGGDGPEVWPPGCDGPSVRWDHLVSTERELELTDICGRSRSRMERSLEQLCWRAGRQGRGA